MNLLRSILSSVWMVDVPTLKAAAPYISRIAKGETVDFYEAEIDVRPFALWQRSNIRYYNYNDAPPGSVAVHTMIGVVTKFDQYCGPSGTETLMRKMKEADSHKNVGAHLLEIDSGGGQATNIESVARFIRNDIKKPVIAWFNGVAASAAYYIAAAADEIYASEETDIVGSIGTMITFADFTQFFEDQGIKIHEVYADQSVLKNIDFNEALEGNYKRLKEGLLNPYAQRFIETVKEFRPLIQKKEVFQGEVYMAVQAIEFGLIDGMKNFNEAAKRAIELGKSHLTQQNNDVNMNFQRINALLGYDIEINNGGAFLQVQELEQIDRNLVTEGHEAVASSSLEVITTQLSSISNGLQALTDKVDANTAAIQKNTEDIGVIGKRPGDEITNVKTDSDADDTNPLMVEYKKEMAEYGVNAQNGLNPFSRS